MNEERQNGVAVAGLLEQLGPLMEMGQRLRQQREPITDPKQILVRRDKEGHRVPESATTPSGIGVTFKVVTEGEKRTYPDWCAGNVFADWAPEEQVRLVNENLVTPDFQKEADGPLTVNWVHDNFDWLTFVEIGTELVKSSRADFRVPKLQSADQKKARGRRTGSTRRSSTRSSTKKGTATRGNGASTS